MANALLERAVQEREDCLSRIETISQAAFEANRDLNADDTDTITRARERVEFLDRQIDSLSFDAELSPRAQAALRSNGVSGRSTAPTSFRSAGDALQVAMAAAKGDRDARTRWDVELNRAAQHMGADAANTVPVAGGLGALVVKPVVGPVIDPTPKGRPFLNALGVQTLTTPLGFSRPRIVDTNGHEAPAVQSQEKAELISRKFDVKLDNVDSETIGQYINISLQLLSLPIDALNMILDRFERRRERMMERRAILEVLETTSVVELAAGPGLGAEEDAGPIYDAVWDAALQVYEKTGELPEGIAMGARGWARLGKLRDKAGRPLFPSLGAANAMGAMSADSLSSTGPAGLPSVVTPGITDGTFVVYNSAGLEVYEYAYPMLESVEAAVLGKQVAVASEVAFHRPSTESDQADRTTAGNGAVKIVLPAAG